MGYSAYQYLKLDLVAFTGLAKDALHIYVGLGVMFAAALIFRRPLSSPLPWLAVLAASCAGELLDMRDDLRTVGQWHWQGSVHDLWNTLFWPTVILVLARTGVLDRLGKRGK